MKQENDDSMTAIARLRWSFKALGLAPPSVLIFDSPEDGRRIFRDISQAAVVSMPHPALTPVEHPDGSVWMEIEAVGMKIRWPATKYPDKEGSFTWGI